MSTAREDRDPKGDRRKAKLGHRLSYLGYRGFEGILKLLPLPFCFTVGGLLGRGAYYLLAPYRRIAQRNMAIAFEGELDAAERHALSKKHFSHLGSNLFSSIKLTTMSSEQVTDRLEIVGAEHVAKGIKDNKGFIYMVSHLGAWEILAQVSAIGQGSARATLYQPLSNPLLDAHVRGRRERQGTKTFDRKDGFNAPIKHLRDGGGLGVLVDQHAGDLGTWCPLFGRLASTSNLAPLMAARTGAALLPVAVATTGRARWRMTIGAPMEVRKSEGVEMATAHVNLEVEKAVRASPADWFWVHNRWKIPKPKFLLTKYKRGITMPRDVSLDTLKRFRIVVRSPNPLGDACMATPAVRAIKRGRPDCELAVLCPENLVGFWKTVSEVDKVIPRPRSASNRKIGKTLAEQGPFDVAILLPNSPRSAIEAKHARIPRVVGYPAKWRDRLVHQIIPARNARTGPRPHHVNHYLRLAERIGADLSDESIFEPPESEIAVEPLRIGISAGAEYGAAKCWPAERFIAACKQIAEQHPGAKFALFGTKAEASIGETLEAGLGELCDNRIGQTSLDGLMDELRACQLLISNDTGTMHLAAHLGVPTVAIFGSTEPHWTGPLGEGHVIIRHHAPCSPCFLRDCPIDFRCMTSITPEEVAEASVEIIDRG